LGPRRGEGGRVSLCRGMDAGEFWNSPGLIKGCLEEELRVITEGIYVIWGGTSLGKQSNEGMKGAGDK